MKRFVGVAVLGVALAIAGCGGSDSGGNSDEDQVNEAISNFSTALSDGDYGAVCEMYSPETQQFFEDTKEVAGDCETLVEETFGSLSDEDLEAFGQAESVTIDGDTATVEQGTGDTTVLQKVDGEWMLTLDQ